MIGDLVRRVLRRDRRIPARYTALGVHGGEISVVTGTVTMRRPWRRGHADALLLIDGPVTFRLRPGDLVHAVLVDASGVERRASAASLSWSRAWPAPASRAGSTVLISIKGGYLS